jgi:hypothetical protein
MKLQLESNCRAAALALAGLAVSAATLTGCGTGAPPAPPAPPNVEAARQQDEAQFAAERQHAAPPK